MTDLYEYQNAEKLGGSLDNLEDFLDEIWAKREVMPSHWNTDPSPSSSQRFLRFLRRTNEVKSNNYVGVIQFENQRINLLPKIFFDSTRWTTENDRLAIHQHILWWLSYCRKIKFPSFRSTLSRQKSDFLEILIHLFARYTRDLLSNTIYQQYEEVNQELNFVKGRIDTNAYINENISKGRWHRVSCSFDAFVMDNRFNRIVKYVSTILSNATRDQGNKKNLRKILFILDEVKDCPATAEDCAKIQFNPMFSEFETVRDYCELFLSSCVSFNYNNDLKLFAFLLPMEYVFEDFVLGFIRKELQEISAQSQAKGYLDMDKSFQIRPDLVLKFGDLEFLADTKYKMAYSKERLEKKRIAQTDLYQMVSYAIRFNVRDVALFYPSNISRISPQSQCEPIQVKDELAQGETNHINAFELPIINHKLFGQAAEPHEPLNNSFAETKQNLAKTLRSALEEMGTG